MMHAEDIRTYCLQKKEVTESFPFDEHTLVFKVAGKIFLLLPLDETLLAFNAKNSPEKSIELREQFTNIQPGFHMNKLHWNTIHVNDEIPTQLIYELIDDSYNLVVAKLPKKVKANW